MRKVGLGKIARMNRLFSHPSGRLCSIAVDHFIGYGDGLPAGLAHIRGTLAAVAAARPDAVTMHRGIATSAWEPFAGKVPFILQSTIARPDDTVCEQIAAPEDAVRLGADGFAVAAFVRGATEGQQLKRVARAVADAVRYDMPVITHIYPRDLRDGAAISYTADDIAWAVRCALECGSDVIKVPFCHDASAFVQIVNDTPVPVVAAGGPLTRSLDDALVMLHQAVRHGARGATVGRNVWNHDRVTDVIRAIQLVVHEGEEPGRAKQAAGLK
jgi:fructose-bisphosphate aldolase, class I